MKLTENYGLKKPDPTDVVNVYDFNYNADIIDSKLKEAEESLSGLELVASNVKMADGSTVENTVSGNKSEILNINSKVDEKADRLELEGSLLHLKSGEINPIKENLSKTENTKYTTANGIKEFSCKDGYVDNVVIEGKTLVNLIRTGLPIKIWDNNRFAIDLIQQNYLEGTYTIYNFSNKAIVVNIAYASNNTWKRDFALDAGLSTKVSIGVDEKLINVNALFSAGWQNSEEGKTEFYKSVVILEGDHTDKPITYFEGLKSVGQGDKIEVLTLTDNLFDENDFVVGSTNSIEGEKFVIDDKATRITHTQPIPVNMFDYLELQYANNVKVFICELDKNDTVLKRYSWSKYPFIRAITPNTKYIRVIFSYDDDRTMTLADYNKINPFLTNKYDKKQILTTLRSLPNGVKDTIEKRGNKYVKVQRCGEYTLVESDVQSIQNIRENCCAIITNRFPNQKKLKNADLKDTLLCNMFSQKPHIKYMEDTEGIHEQVTQNQDMFFDILKSKLPSVDVNGAKTWLKSNPITVVYELETPVITELPNFNPQTFEGNTTLLINSGVIQAEADFEVTNSMGSEIDVLKGKVSSLDDYVDTSNTEILPLLNGFIVEGTRTLTVSRNGNLCVLNGAIKSPTTISKGTVFAKLPLEYLPAKIKTFFGMVTNGLGSHNFIGIDMHTNGTLQFTDTENYQSNRIIKIQCAWEVE